MQMILVQGPHFKNLCLKILNALRNLFVIYQITVPVISKNIFMTHYSLTAQLLILITDGSFRYQTRELTDHKARGENFFLKEWLKISQNK